MFITGNKIIQNVGTILNTILEYRKRVKSKTSRRNQSYACVFFLYMYLSKRWTYKDGIRLNFRSPEIRYVKYGYLNDMENTVTIFFFIYRSRTSGVIVAEQSVVLSSMVIYRFASLSFLPRGHLSSFTVKKHCWEAIMSAINLRYFLHYAAQKGVRSDCKSSRN